MDKLKIDIKKGSSLKDYEIDFITKQREINFNSKPKNIQHFKKEESEIIFFILKLKHEILAFGGLIPIKLNYENKKYNLLGISGVISKDKGEGYGKIIMTKIKNYLFANNITGLGFCDTKIKNFYVKCGFNVIPNLTQRFRSTVISKKQEKMYLEEGGDGIYYNGKDNFIQKLISSKDLVYIDIPFW